MHTCTIPSRETLAARFAEFVSAEDLTRHGAFYESLLRHAEHEADPMSVVMMIATSLSLRDKSGPDAFNISGHIDALAGKGTPVSNIAREIMERVADRINSLSKAPPLRHVDRLPDFPANPLNLKRGSVLKVLSPEVTRWLGIEVGALVQIGFDGESVRHGQFTWSIKQLVEEIGWGAWQIYGETDLSDPAVSLEFARRIEHLDVAMH